MRWTGIFGFGAVGTNLGRQQKVLHNFGAADDDAARGEVDAGGKGGRARQDAQYALRIRRLQQHALFVREPSVVVGHAGGDGPLPGAGHQGKFGRQGLPARQQRRPRALAGLVGVGGRQRRGGEAAAEHGGGSLARHACRAENEARLGGGHFAHKRAEVVVFCRGTASRAAGERFLGPGEGATYLRICHQQGGWA